jgi:glutamate decarboxylase
MAADLSDANLPSRYGARFFTEEIKVMRALVMENVSNTGARTLAGDLAKACTTLDSKGKLDEDDRRRVKRNIGGY